MEDSTKFQCLLCACRESAGLFFAGDRLEVAGERFEVRECRQCGLAVTWPPADEGQLSAFYPDEYWGESADPDQDWLDKTQREKTRFVERLAPAGGRLLDVGCGAGFFLRALRSERWERWGVEISPRSAAVAERHVGEGRVKAGRLADTQLPDESFDVVTFWASLEHVVDPRADLATAHRLLRSSGLLVVQVPNFASAQARRFGSNWFALDVPRHRTHFTPDTLKRLVNEAGFEVVDLLFRSETHDRHSMKQSLKSTLLPKGPFGRMAYYAAAPWLGFADSVMGGATLTLGARK